MRKLLTIIIALAVVTLLAYAIAHSGQEQSGITIPKEIRLNISDVSQILNIAINDIEKQGCQPLFLGRGFIWVRCKDTVKLYHLNKVIELYQAQKDKAKKAPDVKAFDRD